MKFNCHHTDSESKARAGTIKTDHGVIETPIFMPVGTQATVKGILQKDLKDEVNPDIILANTYHLYLRPTTDILERACLLYTSPSPRDRSLSRMPSSA